MELSRPAASDISQASTPVDMPHVQKYGSSLD